MTNHPSRTLVAAARRFARANGYSISEGAYVGTCDDVAGTWYVDHEDDDALDRRGRGYDRQGEAWLAAARAALDLDHGVLLPDGATLAEIAGIAS